MRYSPNSKIAPQYHSSSGRALGAPASGGSKNAFPQSEFRRIVYKRLGQLAKGKPWQTTGYGSMAATPVPGSGKVVRQGDKAAPSRGQAMTAAARNGEDTGVVGPSLVLERKKGVSHADLPVSVRRGKGIPAHQGRRAPSHVSGGRRARQSY